ncbi:rCG36686, isoform CRA_b [Rattus norvegicus]|uniref:RCG36686, isoform CRA_b n=1 Tax=Rattus norvegicus TaxID=10116 RepID=A6JSB7_RAT|nr:rCG36686, isoform CRA_b [Rattus norvegicus]
MAFLAGSFLLLKLAALCWRRSHLPPGPFPFPLLGNLWQLNFRLHPNMLFQLAQTHGNVFTVWLGSTPIVVLNGFRAVKEALVSNSEQFSGRPLTPFFRDLFGEKGVICSNGLTWRQQRRFCLTTLRELGLGKQALELQLQHEAAELAEVFHQEQGRAFDPQVPIIRSTTRVIGALVFGHHFLSEEPIFLELIRAINLGLAFASTTWRRVIGSWGGWHAGCGTVWT